MRFVQHIVCCLTTLVVFLSCANTDRLSQSTVSQYFKGDMFSDHFVGFELFDPANDRILYSQEADKLFTPASNTKILTLFACTQELGDSLLSFKYKNQADTLYVWGMGDPTTLHPYFGGQKRALNFLQAQSKPIKFCLNHVNIARFGPGWAWDDYPYYFQAERSYFPLYGNVVWFEENTDKNLFTYFPNDFNTEIQLGSELILKRREDSNQFSLQIPKIPESNFVRGVPFMTNQNFTAELLTRQIGENISFSQSCPTLIDASEYHSMSVDTAYSLFMKNSDNFIAEQLLIMSSGKKLNVLDPNKIIEDIKSNSLLDIRDELKWVDGSGLSRYNLASPASMVYVLDKLLDNLGFDKIKEIFPAGGESGTILNWYHAEDGIPYIYAKTGTLSGIHCLSGYIQCSSGKIMIFSFMHSNFSGPTSDIKTKMTEVLQTIRKEY